MPLPDRVLDSTGAAIPGAKVTATNVATQLPGVNCYADRNGLGVLPKDQRTLDIVRLRFLLVICPKLVAVTEVFGLPMQAALRLEF